MIYEFGFDCWESTWLRSILNRSNLYHENHTARSVTQPVDEMIRSSDIDETCDRQQREWRPSHCVNQSTFISKEKIKPDRIDAKHIKQTRLAKSADTFGIVLKKRLVLACILTHCLLFLIFARFLNTTNFSAQQFTKPPLAYRRWSHILLCITITT